MYIHWAVLSLEWSRVFWNQNDLAVHIVQNLFVHKSSRTRNNGQEKHLSTTVPIVEAAWNLYLCLHVCHSATMRHSIVSHHHHMHKFACHKCLPLETHNPYICIVFLWLKCVGVSSYLNGSCISSGWTLLQVN